MSAGATRLTPMTPVGALLRPLPTGPLGALFQRLADRLSARHPEVLDRIADVSPARLLLVATDLPWRALITLGPGGAEVAIVRRDAGPEPEAEATVIGPLDRLIACAQGGGDGDAMFFAREIEVSGNSDVLVALRNALDGADLEIAGELAALAGPLRTPVEGAMTRAGNLYARASAALDTFKADIRAPLQARLDAQAEEVSELRAEVQRLRRKQPRGGRTAGRGQPRTSGEEKAEA